MSETVKLLLKTYKFHHLLDTVFVESCLFYLSWKTTCLETPLQLMVALCRIHCTKTTNCRPFCSTIRSHRCSYFIDEYPAQRISNEAIVSILWCQHTVQNTVWCFSNAVSLFSKILATDTHSSPVRARYGVSVVRLTSDLGSVSVIAVSFVILW